MENTSDYQKTELISTVVYSKTVKMCCYLGRGGCYTTFTLLPHNAVSPFTHTNT